MNTTLLLLQQVLMMFLLAGVGFIMFRTGKITSEGSKSLGNILIYLSLPCVIINGFLVERTTEKLLGLLYSAIAAAVILLLSILVSRLFFKKDPIAGFAAAFSNPGFFGVPLIVSMLNSGAVFYIAAFIAFLNLFQWTYGVSIITEKKASLKPVSIIKAPFMIAIIIGIFFFLTGLQMPEIIAKGITHLANLNTALAMFTIGIYLAQTNLKKMFFKKKLYLISFVRLLITPLLSLLVLCLIPAEMMDLKMAVLIASACPVGSNIAVYAQLHNKDYPYAVETVVISTLFSVITLPCIVFLAGLIW